jgi:hypothetical protein
MSERLVALICKEHVISCLVEFIFNFLWAHEACETLKLRCLLVHIDIAHTVCIQSTMSAMCQYNCECTYERQNDLILCQVLIFNFICFSLSEREFSSHSLQYMEKHIHQPLKRRI